MKIFVAGYPGPLGGACTELWHTLKLWRQHDLQVHLIPTWSVPEAEWEKRSTSLGCVTHHAKPARGELEAVPDLPGGTVVSFCNEAFLQQAHVFRELGCRIVWVGCMNWLFPAEKRHYASHGPFDRYVCQSDYQRKTLAPQLARWGVKTEQIHRIHGALDPEEFSFAPKSHFPGSPFVVGRISRASPDKFSPHTWPIMERVDYPVKRFRVLGWSRAVARVIGEPPEWAETLGQGDVAVPDFLRTLHCYCQLNGPTEENWPRTALEAMASGVPIVAERRGGWPEMIVHGRTGFLANSHAEAAHWVAHLAYDEDRRQDMAYRAWLRLVKQLAEPERIMAAWRHLFSGLDQPPPSGPRGSNGCAATSSHGP